MFPTPTSDQASEAAEKYTRNKDLDCLKMFERYLWKKYHYNIVYSFVADISDQGNRPLHFSTLLFKRNKYCTNKRIGNHKIIIYYAFKN